MCSVHLEGELAETFFVNPVKCYNVYIVRQLNYFTYSSYVIKFFIMNEVEAELKVPNDFRRKHCKSSRGLTCDIQIINFIFIWPIENTYCVVRWTMNIWKPWALEDMIHYAIVNERIGFLLNFRMCKSSIEKYRYLPVFSSYWWLGLWKSLGCPVQLEIYYFDYVRHFEYKLSESLNNENKVR